MGESTQAGAVRFPSSLSRAANSEVQVLDTGVQVPCSVHWGRQREDREAMDLALGMLRASRSKKP